MQKLPSLTLAIGLYALVGGLVTLGGWFADRPRLTDWTNTGISMLPNTAVALMCAGTALVLITLKQRRIAAAFGFLAGAIGAATLFEYATGIDLGIDTLVISRPWGQRSTFVPGRMGLPASTSLSILGTAIWLTAGGQKCRTAAAIGGMVVFGITLLSVVGYLYGVDTLFALPKLTAIALQTATMLMALSLGLMVSVAEVEPVRTLFENSSAAVLVRRALPFIILLPVLTGWLGLRGQAAGLYDSAFGTALRTIVDILLLVGLLGWAAAAVKAHEKPLREARQRLEVAQEELTKHAESLEIAVADRTAELRETIGELEAFSYSISHDMRSPLRSMQGFSQILLEEHAEMLNESGKDLLHRIHRASARLDLLIQDVLAYSKIAKGGHSFGSVDLDALIREMVQQYGGVEEEKAAIRIEGPLPSVLGHEALIAQIVSNLIGNAIKFVPAQTKPEIRIWAERKDDQVRVTVADNGIGIDPMHFDRIFEIFGRVYSETKYPGTGIGLAIVKKAAERMGGQVGLESDVGKGSRFWFTVKAANPQGLSTDANISR